MESVNGLKILLKQYPLNGVERVWNTQQIRFPVLRIVKLFPGNRNLIFRRKPLKVNKFPVKCSLTRNTLKYYT